MSASKNFRLLGLSGSLRRKSSSTAILNTLTGVMPQDTQMSVFSLADLPLYNEDIDTPELLPASVAALRAAIAESDGLVLASPEYNHGTPAVLKNAIDWASRPSHYSCLVNKPALVMTVAGSMVGGARAQSHIHSALLACLARIPPGREIVIGGVTKKITDGKLADAGTIQFILNAVDGLLHEACIVQGIAVREGSQDAERRMNLAGR